MADEKPNHRLETVSAPEGEDPRIVTVVGKERFPRPGLETFLAQPSGDRHEDPSRCSCHAVGCYVCTCNKVRVCSCDGYSSSGSRSGGGCRCAPVH